MIAVTFYCLTEYEYLYDSFLWPNTSISMSEHGQQCTDLFITTFTPIIANTIKYKTDTILLLVKINVDCFRYKSDTDAAATSGGDFANSICEIALRSYSNYFEFLYIRNIRHSSTYGGGRLLLAYRIMQCIFGLLS